MKRFSFARLGAALLLLLFPLGLDCKASLDESCRDGNCTAASSTSGGNGECKYSNTAGFPCDVYTVLHENCHTCHTEPPKNDAPFSLLTYADTQVLFGITGKGRWARMAQVVEPGGLPQMPYGKAILKDEKLDVLRAWFATCEAGMCAQGPGGEGGAGATTSSSSASSVSSSSGSTSSGSTGGAGGAGGVGGAGG